MVVRALLRSSLAMLLVSLLFIADAHGQQRQLEVESVQVEPTDDEQLKLHVVLCARHEQGVPVLSNVPYVSRLFKNVGIGRVERTLTIPLQAFLELEAPVADQPEEVQAAFYLTDDVQYFAPGPEFKINAAVACEEPQVQTFDAPAAVSPSCPICPAVRETSFEPANQADPGDTHPIAAHPWAAESAPQPTTQSAEQQQEIFELRAEVQTLQMQQEFYESFFEAQEEMREEREEWIGEMIEVQLHAARLEAALEAAEAREELFEGVIELVAENAQLQARVEILSELGTLEQFTYGPASPTFYAPMAGEWCPAPPQGTVYPSQTLTVTNQPLIEEATTYSDLDVYATVQPVDHADSATIECCNEKDAEIEKLEQRIAELEKVLAELTANQASGTTIR